MDGITKARCAFGTLRMGVFFDGTGNSHVDGDGVSNVFKLFKTYPNQIDPDKPEDPPKDQDSNYPYIQACYIRGVGSKADEKVLGRAKEKHFAGGALHDYDNDDTGGQAFGEGGYARLHGMLYIIERALNNYTKKSEFKLPPQRIEIDLFGFSRGAATARNFLNLIKQDWFNFKGDFAHFKAKDFTFKTLNIFDTVGSFGFGSVADAYIGMENGDDTGTGYTYHVKPGWVTSGITHLTADDEFRENFDLQTLSASTDRDYPIDQPIVSELVWLGAHADVGGSYPPSVEHGRRNNELSKLNLNIMYTAVKKNGVPLLEMPDKFKPNESVVKNYNDLNKYYEDYEDLKVAYKKLKERMAYTSDDGLFDTEAIIDTRIKQKDKLKKQRDKAYKTYAWNKSYKLNKAHSREVRQHNYRVELLKESLYRGVLKCFGNDKNKCKAFLELAANFHNKYVHIPHNTTTGKASENDWTYSREDGLDTIYHRSVYYNKYFDILNSMLSPYPFERLAPNKFTV
jgi:hypothetical protein